MLNVSFLNEGCELVFSKDEMIVDRYADDLSSFDDLFGDGEVFVRRTLVTRGMIVCDDDRSTGGNDSSSKYFSRMNQ